MHTQRAASKAPNNRHQENQPVSSKTQHAITSKKGRLPSGKTVLKMTAAAGGILVGGAVGAGAGVITGVVLAAAGITVLTVAADIAILAGIGLTAGAVATIGLGVLAALVRLIWNCIFDGASKVQKPPVQQPLVVPKAKQKPDGVHPNVASATQPQISTVPSSGSGIPVQQERLITEMADIIEAHLPSPYARERQRSPGDT